MTIRYAVEETLPDGSTKLRPIPPGYGYTWRGAAAYALEMMRRSDWEMVCRAVVTSCSDEED